MDGQCWVDEDDTDLKRMCRNLLFMGRAFSLFEVGLLSLDLLANDPKLANSIEDIRLLCFDSKNTIHHNQDLNHISKIQSILSSISNE